MLTALLFLISILGPVISEGAFATGACSTNNEIRFSTDGPYLMFCSSGTWKHWLLEYSGPSTVPVAADWTVVNGASSSASLTDSTAGLYFQVESGTGGNASGAWRTAPATPYTMTVDLGEYSTRGDTADCSNSGIGFMDNDGAPASANTKYFYRNSCEGAFSSFGDGPGIQYFTTIPGSGTYVRNETITDPVGIKGVLRCLQITDNGTNRLYKASFDCKNYYQLFSETRTNDFTATRIAIFGRGFDVTPGKVNRFTVHSLVIN